MGFNSAFKGLITFENTINLYVYVTIRTSIRVRNVVYNSEIM